MRVTERVIICTKRVARHTVSTRSTEYCPEVWRRGGKGVAARAAEFPESSRAKGACVYACMNLENDLREIFHATSENLSLCKTIEIIFDK